MPGGTNQLIKGILPMTNNTQRFSTSFSHGCRIDSKVLELLHETIHETLPLLQPYVSYTLKQICGKDFWKQLGDYKICLSVDLEDAGKDDHNTDLYRRNNISTRY
jgi:hypothetical protein